MADFKLIIQTNLFCAEYIIKKKIIYIYLNEYFGTFVLINKEMLVQVQNQKLVLLKVLQLPNLYPLHFYKLYKQKYIIRIIKFLEHFQDLLKLTIIVKSKTIIYFKSWERKRKMERRRKKNTDADFNMVKKMWTQTWLSLLLYLTLYFILLVDCLKSLDSIFGHGACQILKVS